ncbi:MAG: cation diffusion facilitator family transporter [Bacteroidales bacterium]|nr:cation diffusion facilitator family transporter [Bacteroidales bacterium]MDT8431191.1 cation diffusion facilitator family transporter [Bacteroidales bacterium]
MRKKGIIYAAWVSIVGNAILAVLKLVVGFISGSFAVVADGIDSSADIISSIVTLVAAKVVRKPPNIKFPYGYVKADTVASTVLSMLIFLAGAQLAISAVGRLIQGDSDEVPAMIAIWVTLFSMAGKIGLSLYLKKTGKKEQSGMMTTMGVHMRNDMLISSTVLIGLLATILFEEAIIDKIIALGISIFIMYEAVMIFLKSNTELMDGVHDSELYDQLFDAIRKVDGAYNPHRTRARKIGSRYMVNLDIEVDPEMKVSDAHDIAKDVEDIIKEDIENVYDVMVHVEPMGNQEKDEKFGITENDVPQRKKKK